MTDVAGLTRPGAHVRSRAERTISGPPTDTGVLFATGLTERGPTGEPIEVNSLRGYERRFAERVAFGRLWDTADVFFREGGSRMVVSRVVGPAATTASVTLQDGSAVDTLEVTGDGPGAWYDDLDIVITQPDNDTFDLVVQKSGDELERWEGLTSPADAENKLENSRYIRATDQGSGSVDARPAEGTFSLSGGDDDRANITQTEWDGALDVFSAELGPGQVAAPGRDGAADHTALLAHADAHRRAALLDVADGDAKATVESSATAAAAETGAERGALFAPWIRVPGVTSGTTRTIPASAFVAALCARRDAEVGHSNHAPAGDRGRARYAIGVVSDFDGDDRTDIHDAGGNVIRTDHDGVLLYGFTGLTNAEWDQFSWARYRSDLEARLGAIAETYVFRTIDGRGQLFQELAGDLRGALKQDFESAPPALFGDTPDDAYTVDVGDEVNTDATIADGQLRAEVAVRMSPFAELVVIDIVKQGL